MGNRDSSWDSPPDSPDHESLSPAEKEAQQNYASSQSDPNHPDWLFGKVLREVELMQEQEATNAAYSDDEDSPDDEDDCMRVQSMEPLPRAQLQEILRRLRMRENPSGNIAKQIVVLVYRRLRDDCSTLVRLEAPPGHLIVVGDIHGHLNDLHFLLDRYGPPSEMNQYLFNGDFVDRGIWGPEVFLTLLCLKLLYPKCVHLNRGNHESKQITDQYGFKRHLTHAFPQDHIVLYHLIHSLFRQLPLCHVVGGKVFVVHGGLPLEEVTLEEIESIPRGHVPYNSKTKADKIFVAMLWSDPGDFDRKSSRGMGAEFSEATTRRFLDRNDLQCIVRSHQCVAKGFQKEHGDFCSTVFSASNYLSVTEGNDADVVVIGSDLSVTEGEPWNQPYVTQKEWAGERGQNSLHDPHANLRKSTCGWRPSAEGLHNRLDFEQQGRRWLGSVKDRAMEELRRMIFLQRPNLLEAFEEVDHVSRVGTADVAGKHRGWITPEKWVQVMTTCMSTSEGFPWAEMGPYLYNLTDTGFVVYPQFLGRYQNWLATWVENEWCMTALEEIAMRLGSCAEKEFDRLDANGDGELSYAQLRNLLHESQPTSRIEALRREQHVFSLFRRLDTTGTGVITKEEFLTEMIHAKEAVRGNNWTKSGFLDEVCCTPCWRTHAALRRKRQDKLEESLDTVNIAVRALCTSHFDLRNLCGEVDVSGNGFIEEQQFIQTVAQLLERGASTYMGNMEKQSYKDMAKELWRCAGLERGGGVAQGGRLRVNDFARCFTITDREWSLDGNSWKKRRQRTLTARRKPHECCELL